MNTYKRTLLQDLDKIFKENNIVENSHYCICVKELIKELPDNKLIKGVITKWYKRSKSIELRFDINNLNLFKVDVKYRISENRVSWFIQYYINVYDEIKNKNKSFVEHLNICLDCIRTEGEYWKKRNGKLTSKDEFSEELISKLEKHFYALQLNQDYKSENLVLGIDRNTFRPTIAPKESLKNCDIYDLKELLERYLKYSKVESENNHIPTFWDSPKFIDIAEKYIKNDIVEPRKQQSKDKKLTKKEFRREFYYIMYKHLEERNRTFSNTKEFKSDLDRLMEREKFLGICPNTLRPFIGIIDGLDGCDVYKIKEFEMLFKKDDTGKFISTSNKKFILEDKKLLEILENKYFENGLSDNLPLMIKAEEHTIDDDSGFVCLYHTRYTPISMYSTIMGKYASYKDFPFAKWAYISKPIYNYMKSLLQEKINHNNKIKLASVYYNEAKKYKKQKDFHKAIECYEKINELNVYRVNNELIECYKRLKDIENKRIKLRNV